MAGILYQSEEIWYLFGNEIFIQIRALNMCTNCYEKWIVILIFDGFLGWINLLYTLDNMKEHYQFVLTEMGGWIKKLASKQKLLENIEPRNFYTN